MTLAVAQEAGIESRADGFTIERVTNKVVVSDSSVSVNDGAMEVM